MAGEPPKSTHAQNGAGGFYGIERKLESKTINTKEARIILHRWSIGYATKPAKYPLENIFQLYWYHHVTK